MTNAHLRAIAPSTLLDGLMILDFESLLLHHPPPLHLHQISLHCYHYHYYYHHYWYPLLGYVEQLVVDQPAVSSDKDQCVIRVLEKK